MPTLSHNQVEAAWRRVACQILEFCWRLFVNLDRPCGFAPGRGMVALDILDQFDIEP